ncbi:MAG: hypothetical protein HYR60_24590 [Acidobacteria bacterium]|nr:hypothetical protein [Acidobacteriota bacterium]
MRLDGINRLVAVAQLKASAANDASSSLAEKQRQALASKAIKSSLAKLSLLSVMHAKFAVPSI